MTPDNQPHPREEGADYEDYDETDDCYECGGEGFIAHCFEPFACRDPEYGCDDCLRRCECNPVPSHD